MGKKRKHERNSSDAEEPHHSPSRKKSKKVSDSSALNLNEEEFEIWLVKKPNCVKIPTETLSGCDLSSDDFGGFEFEDTNFECERQTLKNKKVVLLQKTNDSEDVHEKIEIEPKGTVVISLVSQIKESSLDNIQIDKGPPPIPEGLKQRFIPFGICPEVISKHKHKKKRKSYKN